MGFFKFSAVNSSNETIESYLKADNKSSAESKLHLRGYDEIVLREAKIKLVTSTKASSRDLSVMCRQMSAILSSDMSILEGLLLICEQSNNFALELAVSNVYDQIMGSEHSQLSTAMKGEKIFPSYMVNLVTIGEASGNLDEVFIQLAQYYEKDSRIKQKIRTAVTYPILLTVLMIWVIGLLVVKILPMFDGMLKSMGGELPGITRGFLDMSTFLGQYGLYVLLGIAVIIIFFLWWSTTKVGKKFNDKMKLSIPGVSLLVKRLMTSKFARFLAMMLDSGVPLDESLEKLSDLLENEHIQEKLNKAKDKIKEGVSLAIAVREVGIFPPMLLRMLTVGERTGKLADMLKKSANFYDEDVDEALLRLTTVIEPVLIIILSIIIGTILLSIMLPLINIMRVVG
ncbi:MAG: type II secretion system F family protein [Clostridiales bacterium]|nr:type II secretion system F family protein [Clostridiales bacterium]